LLVLDELGYRTLGWSVLPVIGKKIAVRWKPWQQQRVPVRVLSQMLDRTEVIGTDDLIRQAQDFIRDATT
jgi:hypothetical protein